MEQEYYGTKKVTAWPEEKDGFLGYGIRYYPDGYISWSPKDVFEAAYQSTNALSFEHAIFALKQGLQVSRTAWIRKDCSAPNISQIWTGVDGSFGRVKNADIETKHIGFVIFSYGDSAETEGKYVEWHPSHEDMLAEDYFIFTSPDSA